jgi:hypothetical protein
MLPVSWLLRRINSSSDVINPIALGIVPITLSSARSNEVNHVNNPISDGMHPPIDEVVVVVA